MRPGLDDKRLTAWNALMICALAETGAALRDTPVEDIDPALAQTLLDAASGCAQFVLDELRDERGRLLRSYNDGRAKIDAYLEDHAFLLEATIVLFETTCEERWFEQATALADELIARFSDPERGGFFSTAVDHEPLIARRKDLEDSPIPAGASSAAMGLLRLAQLTGRRGLRAPRRVGAAPAARDRSAPSGGVRAPAAGHALVPLPRAADRLRGAGAPVAERRRLTRAQTHGPAKGATERALMASQRAPTPPRPRRAAAVANASASPAAHHAPPDPNIERPWRC